jgi:hypothetical protein
VIERSRCPPPGDWISALEIVYGAKAHTWDESDPLLAIQRDAGSAGWSRRILELLPDRVAEVHWPIVVRGVAGVNR